MSFLLEVFLKKHYIAKASNIKIQIHLLKHV
jgi:hypothetical protein